MSAPGVGGPDRGGVTFLMVARVPAAAREAFHRYEASVLALLADHGGELERRLVAGDGDVEAHVVWFPDRSAFTAYRADPRRAAITPAPADLGVEVELLEVRDVPLTPG